MTDAYDQLVSEAYLDVKPRFPPVVAAVAAGPPPAAEPSAPRWRFDFSATTPDVGLFPRRAWIRAVERALRAAPDAALDYGDARGRIELRIALSCLPGASARRASRPGSNRRHAGVRPGTRSALPRPVRKGRDHRRDGDAVASRAVGDRQAVRPPARRLSGRLRWPPYRRAAGPRRRRRGRRPGPPVSDRSRHGAGPSPCPRRLGCCARGAGDRG